MPVTFGELSTLTTPLSVMRFWALFWSCLSFSLATSITEPALTPHHLRIFHTFCMVTWCVFFTLTFLVIAINFIQFHSLLPLSWKNLTATVASLGALMTAAATFAFPWVLVDDNRATEPRGLTATVGSFLAVLAYSAELRQIRSQGEEQQRGYMASVPGLLKTLQVFGGCVALILLGASSSWSWQMSMAAAAYAMCLLGSLGTVVVMVGDCAGRFPVPFDRLLAGLTLFGVLAYMATTVVCFSRILQDWTHGNNQLILCSEATIACITLLAYTVDLAFSVKLLCDRN